MKMSKEDYFSIQSQPQENILLFPCIDHDDCCSIFYKWVLDFSFCVTLFMFTYLIIFVWGSNPIEITFGAFVFHLFSYFPCTVGWTGCIIAQTFIFSFAMKTFSKRHTLYTCSYYKRKWKYSRWTLQTNFCQKTCEKHPIIAKKV